MIQKFACKTYFILPLELNRQTCLFSNQKTMTKRDTRQSIIEQASELFYQKGYNLTGINEVIAEAGIAKATLYSHFKSKEDLCLAYLEHRHEAFMEKIKEFCEGKPKGAKQIIAIIEFLQPFYDSKEFNGCWCIRMVAELPKENKKVKAMIRKQKAGFLAFIQQLIEDNMPDKKPKEQKQLARRTYLLYESAVAESHLHGEDWPIHESLKMLKEICQ